MQTSDIVYKRVKIIPDSRDVFIDVVSSMCISNDKKNFFLESLDYEMGDVSDDFYIDKPYRFNLYNYNQKLTAEHIQRIHELGFTEAETNFFNYDSNFLKGNRYIKLKARVEDINYGLYYKLLREKLDWFMPLDDFVLVERPCATTLDDLVFDKNVVAQLVDYIVEMYNNGLWLNNFNNYAIRYNTEKRKFYAYDPDIFYVIEQNEHIKHLSSPREFLDTYIWYKLRQKDIVYRISEPQKLTVEVLNYMYYTYWLLENLCHVAREKLDDY